MERKIAIIGIFVEDLTMSEAVNELLHEYAAVIQGRMGLPFREQNLSVITVVMETDPDTINAVSGKLGRIKGIRVKSMLAK